MLLTNAAGGLRQGFQVGQPVLIADHLNLTARSPIVGANFVDLTDLYSARLRSLAKEIDPSLEEGVYAGLTGPHFETPHGDPHAAHAGRGPRRHVDGPGGHRGPRRRLSRSSASRW